MIDYTSKEYLGKTKNGFDIYVDMKSSHAVIHFNHHPKLFDSVKKVIPTVEMADNIVRVERDVGEEIGITDLLETDDQDEIIYAKRPLRANYSRFVKNKKSTSTTWVTIDLRKTNENECYLYTAFAGRLTPSFPGGDYLPDQSREFWSRHALVWGSQEVISGSETSECPW